ncbi:MAG: RNA 2',3'-cyclic phosphodiesterase [Candidatus Omnitrophica bacterium]|nr:RNA 2',3'-cyclic phosphodiesterase [Candidatus Omnitrophota bacterium]
MLPTIRAFIAIELDERIQRELARLQDRLKTADPEIKFAEPRMRWSAPKNLHITLKFLGDIDPKRLDIIEDTMTETAEEFSVFHMGIGALGAFPNVHDPKIIWAGVTKRANFLAEIAARLDEKLSGHAIEPADHGFTPHITLGRSQHATPCKALTTLLQNIHVPAGLSQKVERISLLRSELMPKGPVYHLLHSVALKKE